jgi:hypothetical protein
MVIVLSRLVKSLGAAAVPFLVVTFTETVLLEALFNLMVKLNAVVPVFPSARLRASIEMVGFTSTGGRQQSVSFFLHEKSSSEKIRKIYFMVNFRGLKLNNVLLGLFRDFYLGKFIFGSV